MDPPRPYHAPYGGPIQPRESDSYGAHHPFHSAQHVSREYGAPQPPPPPPSFGGPGGSPYIPEYADSNSKTRRRGNLPKHVTDVLRMWFQDHVAHPYPTEEEKQQLMHQTGLTISQVSVWNCEGFCYRDSDYHAQISNWFINARRRSLPRMAGQSGTDTDLP